MQRASNTGEFTRPVAGSAAERKNAGEGTDKGPAGPVDGLKSPTTALTPYRVYIVSTVQLILVLHKIEATPRLGSRFGASARVYSVRGPTHTRKPPRSGRVAHEFLLRPVTEDIKVHEGASRRFGRASAVGSRGPPLTRRSLKEESVSPITS